ncbi:ninjurin-1-like isoform X2 [Dermacentor andersoni]|uniref:ninjurin-1-like isoform X2 n=1 Tax=Dermacentor andersoni TaxID=34620 RepID=UPI0024179576|nr:ninjurin-1-like isoform X2 [Dermacentor andersoni]
MLTDLDRQSSKGRSGSGFPLDMNMYATRKTLAQGMLDLALLSSNACQLRRVLSAPPGQRYHGTCVAFLALSVSFQLLAGLLLVLLGRWNINCPWEQRKADLGSPEAPYPPAEPGFVTPSVGPGGKRVRCMDMNLYATKKSIAQGMMDIALLTANASQLKHLLHEGPEANRFYGLTVACVAISIGLQVMVGILLIFNGRYNINKTHQQRRAELFNNVIIIGVFLITVINVFVSAFSGPDSPRWSERSRLP